MSEELLKIMNELVITKTKQELALDVMELTTENLNLQQRIDKAIEYITNINKIDDYLDGVPCDELLSILKGEDHE